MRCSLDLILSFAGRCAEAVQVGKAINESRDPGDRSLRRIYLKELCGMTCLSRRQFGQVAHLRRGERQRDRR